MSKFKNFICEATLKNPHTITYRDWMIVAIEMSGGKVISLCENGEPLFRIYVTTYYNEAMHVYDVTTVSFHTVYDWLDKTCTTHIMPELSYDEFWKYKTWDDVDKLMFKIYDFIRNKS